MIKKISFFFFFLLASCSGGGGSDTNQNDGLLNQPGAEDEVIGESSSFTETVHEALHEEVESVKTQLSTTNHVISLDELHGLEAEGLLSQEELADLAELTQNEKEKEL